MDSLTFLYGKFTSNQVSELKRNLHSSLHWLLLYKDPDTCAKYQHVDVDTYLDHLLKIVGGLNEIFNYPDVYPILIATLQAVRIENRHEPFDWLSYRRLVLDMHKLVDRLPDAEGGDANV